MPNGVGCLGELLRLAGRKATTPRRGVSRWLVRRLHWYKFTTLTLKLHCSVFGEEESPGRPSKATLEEGVLATFAIFRLAILIHNKMNLKNSITQM